MLVEGGQHESVQSRSRGAAAELAKVMRPAQQGIRLIWRDQTTGTPLRNTLPGIPALRCDTLRANTPPHTHTHTEATRVSPASCYVIFHPNYDVSNNKRCRANGRIPRKTHEYCNSVLTVSLRLVNKEGKSRGNTDKELEQSASQVGLSEKLFRSYLSTTDLDV